MPDIAHSTKEPGRTDLVLDAFGVSSGPLTVKIHWDRTLSESAEQTLRILADRLPYLGRSESICTAKLDDHDHCPDSRWWRKGITGDDFEFKALLGSMALRCATSSKPPPPPHASVATCIRPARS